jgi:single-stranded-DNA-specific exonuclease
MHGFDTILPKSMKKKLKLAADAVRASESALAISHIDSDGITALAIIAKLLIRERKNPIWKNIHQLTSETILEVQQLVREIHPDLVIFSDLGSGQISLIKKHIAFEECVKKIIILDHHLPPDNEIKDEIKSEGCEIIEVNPHQHGLDGSYDISGAGVAFLLSYMLSEENVDLSELAVIGATGDLQDYYQNGFVGINQKIIELGEQAGYVNIEADLRFFGINTRPLPFLLEYATDPYLPGITGDRDACFAFFENLNIPMKVDEIWRNWVDLNPDEKQRTIQAIIEIISINYPEHNLKVVGDIVTLQKRPPRTILRTAKEFSTLLNACGRNKRADVGVRLCLGDGVAYHEANSLLQKHRENLARALHKIENDGFTELSGMYLVNDPEIPDTIIGVVIGMAQGSRIVPFDKPIIGVATNVSGDTPFIKISGRAQKFIIEKGVNLKETFTRIAEQLNQEYDELIVEAGGHPMAAGAFVLGDYLNTFIDRVSTELSKILTVEEESPVNRN